jgi:BolA family transcriptional regulator, general stress-responsive regulator
MYTYNPLINLDNSATQTIAHEPTTMLNKSTLSLRFLIEQRLREQFLPTYLSVLDETHEHQGHAGTMGGGQHFAITMQSVAFTGLNAVKKHQLVYTSLADYLVAQHAIDHPMLGYIHALKLQLCS